MVKGHCDFGGKSDVDPEIIAGCGKSVLFSWCQHYSIGLCCPGASSVVITVSFCISVARNLSWLRVHLRFFLPIPAPSFDPYFLSFPP